MPTIRKTMKTISMRSHLHFDHCRDLFRGLVSKYQVISTIFSPGARGSTDLFEFQIIQYRLFHIKWPVGMKGRYFDSPPYTYYIIIVCILFSYMYSTHSQPSWLPTFCKIVLSYASFWRLCTVFYCTFSSSPQTKMLLKGLSTLMHLLAFKFIVLSHFKWMA